MTALRPIASVVAIAVGLVAWAPEPAVVAIGLATLAIVMIAVAAGRLAR